MDPVTLFKCLSDQTRLNCTLLISLEGEVCVCELVEAMGESQPKISRHLAQLRNCGLLSDRRQEQWVYYTLKPGLPKWVTSVIEATSAAHSGALKPIAKKLGAIRNRPNHC
ncbi:metalloregulator ArsR/SmtB family transcription factor [Aurantivibrio infirmus]